MPYFLVEDFRSGLDVRRSPWTSPAGTLQTCRDGHITRGGEVEKRKEFTDLGSLLSSTAALTAGRSTGERGLMVFGSSAAPAGLPAGVTYQRLQHPDTTIAMTEVVATSLYDGKPYVVANYADGSQWHFYDGALVTDWGAGVVRASMTTNDLIAEHLRSLIDADDSYTATRVGDLITVVGPLGVDYETDSETENVAGGVDDQTLTITELEEPIVEVADVEAAAEFSVISGSDDNGVANYIDEVRVDVSGVFTSLLSSNVAFNTSPELTAFDVITNINAGTGTHGYRAETRYGRVFIYAPAADGDSANGRILEVTAKGNVVLYSGGFSISGGTASAGVNMVTSVKANGLEILGANVDWATSNAATATAVAAQIVAYASSPKYNAYAEGETVFCSPEKIRSDDPTSITLVATSAGDVTFEPGATPQVEDQYDDYDDVGACVAVDSYLPTGFAGEVRVGDTLSLADPDTLEPAEGVVSYSEAGKQRCYRIVTSSGASLVCSRTAPIPVRAGGLRRPAQLMGHQVAVRRGLIADWETVVDVAPAGFQKIQHITVGDRCFWAGERPGVYLLHHNIKSAP